MIGREQYAISTTILFIVVSLAVVLNTSIAFPADTLVGFCLLVVAIPVYYVLRRYER